MKITILTLFPQIFDSAFKYSIVNRAIKKKAIVLEILNIRNFSQDRYKSVDDHPYGGGVGMIMRVDVIDRVLSSVKFKVQSSKFREKSILLDPTGKRYHQTTAFKFSKLDHLILVCGHYEGVDARTEKLVDEVISVGDYILTGGEIPAMLIVDSLARLQKGVLKKREATVFESFSTDQSGKSLLEPEQYTRPRRYKNLSVPSVLLSGNHQKIRLWREQRSVLRTQKRRPDMLIVK